MHALRHCLIEASKSLWRQRASSLLSVLTITAAALVVGGFVLVTVNLERVLARWSATAEVTIYLRDDITQDQRVELNRMLEASPAVASRQFVSKADALARFRRDFPDLVQGLEGLPENPLPASIDLGLKADAAATAAVETLTQSAQRMPGVSDVRFDRQWLSRLSSIIAVVRWIGWVLGGVLVAAALLTVSTVVRLALHARRNEMEIMELVGAPIGLLRGPLVIEGMLQGGVGAAGALLLLYVGYATVMARASTILLAMTEPGAIGFLSPLTTAIVMAGGLVVGCLGGWLAARRIGRQV